MNKLKELKNYKTLIFSVLFAITSVLIIWARSEMINGDTEWHIMVGDWILKNKKYPYYDMFSQFTTIDGYTLKFLAHEWVFDIVVSVLHSIGKLNLLYFVTVITIFGGHLFVIKNNKGTNKIISMLVMLGFTSVGLHKELWITADTFAIFILIYLNLMLVNWFRNYDITNFKRLLIKNSIITLFLANFHGGMLTALLITYFIILIIGNTLYVKNNSKPSCLLFITTFLAGLINPNFIRVYSYSYMSSSSGGQYITDWFTFAFNNSVEIIVVGFIILLALIGFIKSLQDSNNSKDIILDGLIFGMYLAMLLRFARTVNIFTIVFALYMSKYIGVTLHMVNSNIIQKSITRRALKTLCITSLVLLCVIDASIIYSKSEKNITIQEYSKRYISEDMINYIKRDNGQIKIFNEISLGGKLISLGINPYIDGRTDPYLVEYGNPNILERSIKAVHSERVMNELTFKEEIDCLLLKKNTLNSEIFYASDIWESKYETDDVVMFIRRK